VRVKGKLEPQLVHEALDRRAAGEPTFVALYERGLAAWGEGRLPAARALFVAADGARAGGDPPSRFYVERCDELLARGPSPDFERAFEVSK
jgi:hypothetical protein